MTSISPDLIYSESLLPLSGHSSFKYTVLSTSQHSAVNQPEPQHGSFLKSTPNAQRSDIRVTGAEELSVGPTTFFIECPDRLSLSIYNGHLLCCFSHHPTHIKHFRVLLQVVRLSHFFVSSLSSDFHLLTPQLLRDMSSGVYRSEDSVESSFMI